MPSSKARLLIPASSDWFNCLHPLPTTSIPVVSQSASQIANLFDRASSLHTSELATFSALPNATGGSASDRAFLRNILSGGTLSDRLSALTLMVQGAPLHNVRALEALKDLTERGRGGVNASQDGVKGKGKATGREDRLRAARAIMDWWVGGGVPNRKLRGVSLTSPIIYAFLESRPRYFRDQALLHSDVTDQHLVIWYFEDWLKKYFFSYLQILEVPQEPLSSTRVTHHSPGLFVRSPPICPHAVPRLNSHSASLPSRARAKFTTFAREQACAFAYFLSKISFGDAFTISG